MKPLNLSFFGFISDMLITGAVCSVSDCARNCPAHHSTNRHPMICVHCAMSFLIVGFVQENGRLALPPFSVVGAEFKPPMTFSRSVFVEVPKHARLPLPHIQPLATHGINPTQHQTMNADGIAERPLQFQPFAPFHH